MCMSSQGPQDGLQAFGHRLHTGPVVRIVHEATFNNLLERFRDLVLAKEVFGGLPLHNNTSIEQQHRRSLR